MLFRPNGVLVNFRLACPHHAVHLERLADLTREVVVGILSLVKVNVCGGEFFVAAAVAAPILIAIFVVALAAADALVFLALVRILIAAAVIVAAGRIEDVHQSGGRNPPSGGLLVT